MPWLLPIFFLSAGLILLLRIYERPCKNQIKDRTKNRMIIKLNWKLNGKLNWISNWKSKIKWKIELNINCELISPSYIKTSHTKSKIIILTQNKLHGNHEYLVVKQFFYADPKYSPFVWEINLYASFTIIISIFVTMYYVVNYHLAFCC